MLCAAASSITMYVAHNVHVAHNMNMGVCLEGGGSRGRRCLSIIYLPGSRKIALYWAKVLYRQCLGVIRGCYCELLQLNRGLLQNKGKSCT